jgi:hypothetical protein
MFLADPRDGDALDLEDGQGAPARRKVTRLVLSPRRSHWAIFNDSPSSGYDAYVAVLAR